MKAIKAIVKQKLGIDPTVCSYCRSPNLVTEMLEATSSLSDTIYLQNGNLRSNRAPPKLPRHGLEEWMDIRA